MCAKMVNKKNTEKIGLPIKIKKTVKRYRPVKKTDTDIEKDNVFEVQADHLFEKEEKQRYDKIIKDYYLKIERDKSLIMWSGVTFFMVLIVSLWVYNTKLTFQKISRERASVPEIEFYQLTENIENKINEIEERLGEIKKEGVVNIEENISEEQTVLHQEEENKPIEELKDVLEKNLEKTN